MERTRTDTDCHGRAPACAEATAGRRTRTDGCSRGAGAVGDVCGPSEGGTWRAGGCEGGKGGKSGKGGKGGLGNDGEDGRDGGMADGRWQMAEERLGSRLEA